MSFWALQEFTSELAVEVRKIVEAAIVGDVGNASIRLYQQFTRLVQPHIVQKGKECLFCPLMEPAAE